MTTTTNFRQRLPACLGGDWPEPCPLEARVERAQHGMEEYPRHATSGGLSGVTPRCQRRCVGLLWPFHGIDPRLACRAL